MLIAALHSRSEADTHGFAREFASLLEPGDVVALRGGLGAGKTLFVRGLVEGLGGEPEEVHSPTFTLVHRYDTRPVLYHLDLYRLEGAEEELIELGFEEYFEPRGAVAAVEWAELAGWLLPPHRFDVSLAPEGEGRRIEAVWLGGSSERRERLRAFAARWLRAPESGEPPWR